MRGRNKLKRRAKIAEAKSEMANEVRAYCDESGKVCFDTRAEAERTARSMERRHKGHGISVYMCDACGCYHTTRTGYIISKDIRQNKITNSGVLYE